MFPRGVGTIGIAREEIVGGLAEIYESSLDAGEVTDDWRAALFKKGCEESLGTLDL